MSVPGTEASTTPPEHVPGEEQAPAAGWQQWLERFQAMCSERNVTPAELTAGKRPLLAIITANHLHDDTVDYYAHVYGPRPEQGSSHRPEPLPTQPVHRQLGNYYQRFPPVPTGIPEDRARAADRRDYHIRYQDIAIESSDNFREIRVARRLRAHLMVSGQTEAAEAVGELLISYGMVVETLQYLAKNTLHPPPLALGITRPFDAPLPVEVPEDSTDDPQPPDKPEANPEA
jgi:hypothetical protein